jgi:hypothetical protein
MNWLYWIGGGLFLVAAVAIFMAFRNEKFVARLIAFATSKAVKALWKAIAPAFKPRPLTEEEKDRNKSGFPPFSRDR